MTANGQLYFVPDAAEVFLLASFAGDMPSGLTKFYVQGTKRMIQVEKKNCVLAPAQLAENVTSIEDLVNLVEVNPASILHCTRLRFEEGLIYTALGQVLMVINPFSPIPDLYGAGMIERYKHTSGSGTSPHIYAIASRAFTSMSISGKAQSILISGESGAGKTEATKQCLDMLTAMSSGNSRLSIAPIGSRSPQRGSLAIQVTQKILAASPLLEAFGNAQTVRNANSSRFGKWMELTFSSTSPSKIKDANQVSSLSNPMIRDSSITCYLLEKGRVTQRDAAKERNFHIFYQVLAGASSDTLERLFLQPDCSQYRYLMKKSPQTTSSSNSGSSNRVGKLGNIFPGINNQRPNDGPSPRSAPSSSPAPFRGALAKDLMEETDFKDAENYERTLSAMAEVGLGGITEATLSVVAAVLLLGNIEFASTIDGCRATGKEVEAAASLLGVSAEQLAFALCHRTIFAGKRGEAANEPGARETAAKRSSRIETKLLEGNKPDFISRDDQTASEDCVGTEVGNSTHIKLTPEAASNTRDSLARALYDGLFKELIRGMNNSAALPAQEVTAAASSSIGILDIFGFEIFKDNSFEQLCINYCNEMLQQHFNFVIFSREQTLYSQENIQCEFVSEFSKLGNEMVTRDIEELMAALDEEARIPKGSSKSWYEKSKRAVSTTTPVLASTTAASSSTAFSAGAALSLSHITFPARKDVFVVKHYAGAVEYNPFQFLEKNAETLNAGVLDCMTGSAEELVSRIFQFRREEDGPSRTPTSTSGMNKSLYRTFRASLTELMALIRSTDSHFVRCIKSNEGSRPLTFDSTCVQKQLLYSGIFDVVRIQQAGLPIRLGHAEFVSRYLPLVPSDLRYSVGSVGDILEALVGGVISRRPQRIGRLVSPLPLNLQVVKLGKSLVFYRGLEQAVLEDALRGLVISAATIITARARAAAYSRTYQAVLKSRAELQHHLSRMDLPMAKSSLLLLRHCVLCYANLTSGQSLTAMNATAGNTMQGIYSVFDTARLAVERLSHQIDLMEQSQVSLSLMSLDSLDNLQDLLDAAAELDLMNFESIKACQALFSEYQYACCLVELFIPRKMASRASIAIQYPSTFNLSVEDEDGNLPEKGLVASDLSKAEIAAGIVILQKYISVIPLCGQAIEKAKTRLVLVEKEEVQVFLPLQRALERESLIYDEVSHSIKPAQALSIPSSYSADAVSAAHGLSLSPAASVNEIVSQMHIEHILTKPTRLLYLDARIFLRLRDELLPSLDGLAVLHVVESSAPRTQFLGEQFEVFRSWADIQLSTVALKEALIVGSIPDTADDSFPVQTQRLRELLEELSAIDIGTESPQHFHSSAVPEKRGSVSLGSRVKSVIAAARWVLRLRELYLEKDWSSMEALCWGVDGTRSELHPGGVPNVPFDSAINCAIKSSSSTPSASVLSLVKGFTLAEYPALEVEQIRALWQVKYHTLLNDVTSHVSLAVFADPSVTLASTIWSSFSADNVGALACLEKARSFVKLQTDLVPVLGWLVDVLEVIISLRASAARGDLSNSLEHIALCELRLLKFDNPMGNAADTGTASDYLSPESMQLISDVKTVVHIECGQARMLLDIALAEKGLDAALSSADTCKPYPYVPPLVAWNPENSFDFDGMSGIGKGNSSKMFETIDVLYPQSLAGETENLQRAVSEIEALLDRQQSTAQSLSPSSSTKVNLATCILQGRILIRLEYCGLSSAQATSNGSAWRSAGVKESSPFTPLLEKIAHFLSSPLPAGLIDGFSSSPQTSNNPASSDKTRGSTSASPVTLASRNSLSAEKARTSVTFAGSSPGNSGSTPTSRGSISGSGSEEKSSSKCRSPSMRTPNRFSLSTASQSIECYHSAFGTRPVVPIGSMTELGIIQSELMRRQFVYGLLVVLSRNHVRGTAGNGLAINLDKVTNSIELYETTTALASKIHNVGLTPHMNCLALWTKAYLSLLQAAHFEDWAAVKAMRRALMGSISYRVRPAQPQSVTNRGLFEAVEEAKDAKESWTANSNQDEALYSFLPSDLNAACAWTIEQIYDECASVDTLNNLRLALERLQLPTDPTSLSPSLTVPNDLGNLALGSPSSRLTPTTPSQSHSKTGTKASPSSRQSVYSKAIKVETLAEALDALNPAHLGEKTVRLSTLGQRVLSLLQELSAGRALTVDMSLIKNIVTDYSLLGLDSQGVAGTLNYVRVRQLVRTINQAISTYQNASELRRVIDEIKRSIEFLPKELLPWLSAATLYGHLLQAHESRQWSLIVQYTEKLETIYEKLVKFQIQLRDAENVALFLSSLERAIAGSYQAALEIKADDARGVKPPAQLSGGKSNSSTAITASSPMPPPAPQKANGEITGNARRQQILLEDSANPNGVSKLRLHGLSDEQIYAANFPIEVLWATNFPSAVLKTKGYTACRLKDVGYTAFDLYQGGGFSLSQLRAAKFDAEDLRIAGCCIDQLRAAGYSDAEIALSGFSMTSLRNSGLDAARLARRGVECSRLIKMGFSAMELRAAGFDARQLRESGFLNVHELLAAGFAVPRLLSSGFTLQTLRQSGVAYHHLRQCGYNEEVLLNSGYVEEVEQEVLMALYSACSGEAWSCRRGWGSRAHVKDWFGVRCQTVDASPQQNATPEADNREQWEIDLRPSSAGHAAQARSPKMNVVMSLELPSNQLRGRLPETLHLLQFAKYINFSSNNLAGSLPSGLRERVKASSLALDLTGNILLSLSDYDTQLLAESLKKRHGQDLPGSSKASSAQGNGGNNNAASPLPSAFAHKTGALQRSPSPKRISFAAPSNQTGTPGVSHNASVAKNVLDESFPRVKVQIAAKDKFGTPLTLDLPSLDERAALIQFFRSTGGKNWKQKTGWCSSQPLSSWFGVKVGSGGKVVKLILPYNELRGDLPDCLGCLTFLVELDVRYNQLSGLTPALGALSKLRVLHAHCNKMRGDIPLYIAGCRELQLLDLHSNCFSGMVPVTELGGLLGLQYVNLTSNLWAQGESVERVRRGLPHTRAVLL